MKLKNDLIINKTEINFAQTLKCGQIFSYKETSSGFEIFSRDKKAVVYERENDYLIETNEIEYFKNYFDLNTDYKLIKNKLNDFKVMQKPIEFGAGIRILKQDLLEIIVSFAISANNNIKRITNTLFGLREKFGAKMNGYFSFPTLAQLSSIRESDFKALGAGYRSSQLVKLIQQLNESDVNSWAKLPTEILKNKLIELSGVGPKVADCILLFGYGKYDVFPVDTWIEKCYNHYFGKSLNRIFIRKELIKTFGNLAGYAQQYLFYYSRSGDALNNS